MDETDNQLVERLNARLTGHRDEEVQLQQELLSLQARLAGSRQKQDALQVAIRDLDGTPTRDDRPLRLPNGMLLMAPAAVDPNAYKDFPDPEIVDVTDGGPDGQRPTIRRLALALARGQGGEFRVRDLFTLTQANGFKSDHGGLHTSLKAMKEFEHSGRGTFRLIVDTDDPGEVD